MVEKRVVELERELSDTKVKLAQTKRVNSARNKEVADLKVTMEESETKFYDVGFANAENSSEPIMLDSWRGFSFQGP